MCIHIYIYTDIYAYVFICAHRHDTANIGLFTYAIINKRKEK